MKVLSFDEYKLLSCFRQASVAEQKALIAALSVLYAREGKPLDRKTVIALKPGPEDVQ